MRGAVPRLPGQAWVAPTTAPDGPQRGVAGDLPSLNRPVGCTARGQRSGPVSARVADPPMPAAAGIRPGAVARAAGPCSALAGRRQQIGPRAAQMPDEDIDGVVDEWDSNYSFVHEPNAKTLALSPTVKRRRGRRNKKASR